MKTRLLHRIQLRLNLPLGLLLAFLQRTPVARVIASAIDYVEMSPAGSLLKTSVASLVALGAVDTLAGATPLTVAPTSDASPLNVNVGDTVNIAFNVENTETAPLSWKVSGTIPPGLAFYSTSSGTSGGSTQAATINTSVANDGSLYFRGSPTTAGSYTMNLQAFQGSNGSEISSPIYQYMVVVGAASMPTPTPTPTPTPAPTGNAPSITGDPVSENVSVGSNATFYVTATGATSYQWQKNGTSISGATNASLALTNVQPGDSGNYMVVVSNSTGSVTSHTATLSVGAPQQGRLINLSVRTSAGSGAQTLIAGFIISGGASKTLMVRGTGPTLANFGLSGVLSDPRVDLYQGQTVVASNDSWQSAPNVADIQAIGGNKLGSFTLDPKDAVLLTSLTPNAYTAQVVASTGGAGVALVEVDDEDPGQPGDGSYAAQSRLINLSARTEVGTGANILIAGFIINGNVPKRLMIRGLGPSLANFGVGGLLADPVLTIFDQNGNQIAVNDNWATNANASDITAASGNMLGQYPIDPKDAVLVITLPPGSYTAQVVGSGGGTGVALVEVDDLD